MYCGKTCQRADWKHHKHQCSLHLNSVFLFVFWKGKLFQDQKFHTLYKVLFLLWPAAGAKILAISVFLYRFLFENEANLRKFRPRVQKVYLLASQKVNFLPFWNPKGRKVYPKRLKKTLPTPLFPIHTDLRIGSNWSWCGYLKSENECFHCKTQRKSPRYVSNLITSLWLHKSIVFEVI